MREVTFVSGLKIERARVADTRQHFEYYNLPALPTLLADGNALIAEQTVECVVVPIHHLRGLDRRTRSDTYIAYSREVEELLALPFKVLSERVAAQDAQLSKLRGWLDDYTDATFWQRVRFLFFRRLGRRNDVP